MDFVNSNLQKLCGGLNVVGVRFVLSCIYRLPSFPCVLSAEIDFFTVNDAQNSTTALYDEKMQGK